MEIKMMVLITWFGMSGSSLSLDYIGNWGEWPPVLVLRLHHRHCWLPTQEPFPPMFLENRTLILPHCAQRNWARPSQGWFFTVMIIPFSFAKDWLRGVEAARQCKIQFCPGRPKGSMLGGEFGNIFSSLIKRVIFPSFDAVVWRMWCLEPWQPSCDSGSKTKARMLRIAKGIDGKAKILDYIFVSLNW